MVLGKRKPKQDELFAATAQVATGPGHPFYTKLNEVLAGAGFDEFVEELCARYYKEGGRPSIPPGVYFRMLFIGYSEGLDSQRGIAWRCADGLGLRTFLGIAITEDTPKTGRKRVGSQYRSLLIDIYNPAERSPNHSTVRFPMICVAQS